MSDKPLDGEIVPHDHIVSDWIDIPPIENGDVIVVNTNWMTGKVDISLEKAPLTIDGELTPPLLEHKK